MTTEALDRWITSSISLPRNFDTCVRALLTATAITAAFLTTYFKPGSDALSKEFEALFLLMLAYYFADRPHTNRERTLLIAREHDDKETALSTKIELWSQFAVGLVLVGGSAALFLLRTKTGEFRSELAAAWIAGVALAVGFYFKKTAIEAADEVLSTCRVILAFVIFAAAVAMVLVRAGAPPAQWVSLMAITAAFYFKER